MTHTWRGVRGSQKEGAARCCCAGAGRERELQALGSFSRCYKYQGAWFLYHQLCPEGILPRGSQRCFRVGLHETNVTFLCQRKGRGDENLSLLTVIPASNISVELLWAGSTALKNRVFGKNNLIHCFRVTNSTLIMSRMVCMLV